MSAPTQISEQNCTVEFKQILVATDFSDASRQALAYALAISRRSHATLSVVHAIPPEPREPIPFEPLPRHLNRRWIEADQHMRALENENRMGDVEHRKLVQQGEVWDILASIIRLDSIDLLVLGSHGRGGLKKALLGSVAEEVLRMATCPVLTIGPRVPPPDSEPINFRRILFATDFGAAAEKALPYVLALAQDHAAKLVLLHMMAPPALAELGPRAYGPSAYAAEEFTKWQHRSREESLAKLRALIPAHTEMASEPEFLAGANFVPEGILEASAAHNVDLIIMGAERTSSPRLAAHLPWSLTHAVISRALCPVLTIGN